MPTRIAIASSQAEDTQEAALQAATHIEEQLDGHPANLVVLFACGPYAKPETLESVNNILRPERLIGSSVNGIILSDKTLRRGLGILAIHSTEMAFGMACTRPLPGDDARTTGFTWARQMSTDCRIHQHRACLMFVDPGLYISPQFVRGCEEVLGFAIPIVGAISSGEAKTGQFFQKQVLTQSATGLLIAGANVAVGSHHGFKPLGKPRTITEVENNIIRTIDGKPASHIYEEYLDIRTSNRENFFSQTALYPLGIYQEKTGKYLLKNAVDIRVDGSIVCQGEVPQGAELHLMIGNRDSCKQSAAAAATQVKEALEGRQPKLVMVIESAVRQRILKTYSFLEIQSVKEVLGANVPLIGIYGAGELTALTPVHDTSRLQIQNGSFVVMAIY